MRFKAAFRKNELTCCGVSLICSWTGANVYMDEHVALFDDVIGRRSRGIEAKVRAELSNRLAPIANAPLTVIKALGSDDARRYVQFYKTLHVLFDRFRARNTACRKFRPE
jgi:hypothetical protein